jgi:hypothetical protein
MRLPVISGQEGLLVGDQIAQSHPLPPGKPARISDISPQGYSILKTRHDRQEPDNIAVSELTPEAFWIH